MVTREDKKKRKKIITREIVYFAVYFVIIVMISLHSSTSVTHVAGKVQTRFFPELLALHLVAWLGIYGIVRGIMWVLRH